MSLVGVKIAGFAKGFLDLLGLQSFGEMPKDLSGTIVPTIEQLEMFLASKQVTLGGGSTTPATGFNVVNAPTFTVPAGEVWVLKAATAFGVAEAGVTFQVSPSLRFGGSIAPTLCAPQPVGASSSSSNGVVMPPLWLPSGTELGVRIDALTGAPTAASTFNLNVLVAKLRAGG